MTAAVGIVHYGAPLDGGLGAVPLDDLLWPLGRPGRLATGTVDRMAPTDHLLTFPRTFLWWKALPRCRTSLMIVEPRAVHAKHMRLARLFGRRFHRILTHDAATLRACPNARFNVFGTSFVTDPDRDTTKSRGISLIASAKRDLDGHRLRHAVIDALPPDAGVDVMGRGYRPFDTKEDGLAPYRYSVVIENIREAGYMTEKLVDALICRTVPIYWGAPNIADYLDPDGLIICQTKEEILAAIDGATESGYAARAGAIERNRQTALVMADLYGRAARTILEEDK